MEILLEHSIFRHCWQIMNIRHTSWQKLESQSQAEVLSKIMEDLFDKYYGDIIEKDDLIYIFWARVPHFFNSPFYVYQYATCFASSAILYEKMINSSDESEKKQTLDKYIQLLSSGGNDFPMEQLKKAGVDLSKIETIEAVAKQFDLLLDKLEVEIGKL